MANFWKFRFEIQIYLYRATLWKMKFTHLTNMSSYSIYNDKDIQWHLEYLEEQTKQQTRVTSSHCLIWTLLIKNIQHELAIVSGIVRDSRSLLKVLLFLYDTWIYYIQKTVICIVLYPYTVLRFTIIFNSWMNNNNIMW